MILGILDYNTFGDDYIRVAKSVESSIAYLWFRIKGYDDRFIYEKAKLLRNEISHCKLILSESIALADILKFDGVHLNKNSIPIHKAKVIAKNLIVGYSAHSVDEVESINADYFTLSPIFEAKSDDKAIITIDKLETAKNVFALGGVKLADYNDIINRGFYGVAGIRLLEELANRETTS